MLHKLVWQETVNREYVHYRWTSSWHMTSTLHWKLMASPRLTRSMSKWSTQMRSMRYLIASLMERYWACTSCLSIHSGCICPTNATTAISTSWVSLLQGASIIRMMRFFLGDNVFQEALAVSNRLPLPICRSIYPPISYHAFICPPISYSLIHSAPSPLYPSVCPSFNCLSTHFLPCRPARLRLI